MHFFYLRIDSVYSWDLKEFCRLIDKNTYHVFENVNQKITRKNKLKRFAILISPHVNKTAQESFEKRTFTRQFKVFSHRKQQYFLFLKKLNHCLFPNLNIKLEFLKTLDVNDASPKIFNIQNFKIKKLENIKLNPYVNSAFKIADVLGYVIRPFNKKQIDIKIKWF